MHYLCLVIYDKDSIIEDLMAPYDENLKVEKVTDEYGDTYWINPKALYDYYLVGGRWAGALKLKDGVEWEKWMFGDKSWHFDDNPYEDGRHVDTAFLSDIDMSFDMDAYQKCCNYWDKDHPSYLIEEYISKENYAFMRSIFSCPRVITPDGEYHSLESTNILDSIKWAQEFKRRFIYPYDKCAYKIAVVDMHI